MNEQKHSPAGENRRGNERGNEMDRFGAVRDPGATPRRSLKNNNIAVVHSSDLDAEPNAEIHEAYEDEEKAPKQ